MNPPEKIRGKIAGALSKLAILLGLFALLFIVFLIPEKRVKPAEDSVKEGSGAPATESPASS